MTDAEKEPGFWETQGRRLALRWIVVSYALISLAFWTATILSAAWLRHFGFSWAVYLGGAAWLYFALPTLYVHAELMVDVLGYALTQKTYFFPVLLEGSKVTESDFLASMEPGARSLYLRLRPLFRAASFTSPFAGPATWALIVLVRAPSEVHLRSHATRSEIRQALSIGRKIEISVTEGYAARQMASFAA